MGEANMYENDEWCYERFSLEFTCVLVAKGVSGRE